MSQTRNSSEDEIANVNFLRRHIHALQNIIDSCINSAIHLNVTYEIIVCKLKFYERLYFKSGFLHDVFLSALDMFMSMRYTNLRFIIIIIIWAALLSDRSDDCLRSVFIPLHIATDSVLKIL